MTTFTTQDRQDAQRDTEPVGYVVQWVDGSLTHAWCTEAPPVGTPLYIHPAKTLTDAQRTPVVIQRHNDIVVEFRPSTQVSRVLF